MMERIHEVCDTLTVEIYRVGLASRLASRCQLRAKFDTVSSESDLGSDHLDLGSDHG